LVVTIWTRCILVVTIWNGILYDSYQKIHFPNTQPLWKRKVRFFKGFDIFNLQIIIYWLISSTLHSFGGIEQVIFALNRLFFYFLMEACVRKFWDITSETIACLDCIIWKKFHVKTFSYSKFQNYYFPKVRVFLSFWGSGSILRGLKSNFILY
jgi:hypothetical protein